MKNPKVAVLVGSDSDLPVMQRSFDMLDYFGIPYIVTIASAHRTPQRTSRIARTASQKGIAVIIAGAGWAAHLAGAIAAQTILPVIAVPIDSSPLHGLDSLLSTVQMPSGVPVAAVSIGSTGAANAAIYAAQILALSDGGIQRKLIKYKKLLKTQVLAAAKKTGSGLHYSKK